MTETGFSDYIYFAIVAGGPILLLAVAAWAMMRNKKAGPRRRSPTVEAVRQGQPGPAPVNPTTPPTTAASTSSVRSYDTPGS